MSTPEDALTGDAACLRAFLLWARSAGLDVAALQVGACRIELRPAVAAAQVGETAPRPERRGIHEQFGGPMFSEFVMTLPADDAGEFVPALRVK